MSDDGPSITTILDNYDGDAAAFSQLYGLFGLMIMQWLSTTTLQDIVLHPLSQEETWEVPDGYVMSAECDNATTEGFSIGWLSFGNLNGVRCVLEQNASPLGIWIHNSDLHKVT